MNNVYLLLGSNIEPAKNIPLAIQSLRDSTLLDIKGVSSTWQTKAVGSPAADFFNVAVNLHTSCELNCLKEMVIGEIEKQLGRVRTEDKNAPRTIDLDVIVFNDQVIDKEVFSLDHILLPMAEMLPDLFSKELGCTLRDLFLNRIKQTRAIKVN